MTKLEEAKKKLAQVREGLGNMGLESYAVDLIDAENLVDEHIQALKDSGEIADENWVEIPGPDPWER